MLTSRGVWRFINKEVPVGRAMAPLKPEAVVVVQAQLAQTHLLQLPEMVEPEVLG
jgi:hypothetical protein